MESLGISECNIAYIIGKLISGKFGFEAKTQQKAVVCSAPKSQLREEDKSPLFRRRGGGGGGAWPPRADLVTMVTRGETAAQDATGCNQMQLRNKLL